MTKILFFFCKIRKLAALYDNYNRDVNVVEDNTQQEQDEETEFLQV